MKRIAVLVCAGAMALLSAATAWAGVGATVLLKSGNRISGELIDLNASGLVVRSGGRERAIPLGDVAVIDLQGNASDLPGKETERAAGGVIVLRNGQLVDGTLNDIGGSAPLRFSVDTRNGPRDFSSDEVARIYLSDVPGGAAAAPTTLPGTVPGKIQVLGRQQWTRTGVYVKQGERVFISASGEVRLSEDPSDTATPFGSTKQRYAPGAPLPRELAGALIGRIGNGRPFGLGNPNAQVPMPAAGELWLGVNDDATGDNEGAFTVEVRGGSNRPSSPRR
jgi:hypothetical protein